MAFYRDPVAYQNAGRSHVSMFNDAIAVGRGMWALGKAAAAYYANKRIRSSMESWRTGSFPGQIIEGSAGDEENPRRKKLLRRVRNGTIVKEYGRKPYLRPDPSTQTTDESKLTPDLSQKSISNTIPDTDYSTPFDIVQPLDETMSTTASTSVPSMSSIFPDRNNFGKMNETNKWRAAPIVLPHHAKGSNYPHLKPIILTGYRNQELSCDSGKSEYTANFSWNNNTELVKQWRIAIDNMNRQTGFFNGPNGDGHTAVMAEESRRNNTFCYDLLHKKEYIISNSSNTDCCVILTLMGLKRDSAETLVGCLLDTTHELETGTLKLRWNNDVEGDGGIVNTPIDRNDYRFDPFAHRYKVRKNFRNLGRRVINLKPGHSVTIPVMDKGPRKISKIYIDESADANITQLAGYFRLAFIQLRGTDIAYHQLNTNYAVSTASTSVSIIEKSTIVLKAVPTMRKKTYFFTSTAPTDNSVGNTTYHKLAEIPLADQYVRNVEDETEMKTDLH